MPSPADPHDTAFQAALNRILRKGIASADEMARQCDRSPQHIRAVARGDHHMGAEAKEELSSWLCDARDCTIQVDGMLGLTYETHRRPTEHDGDDCLLEEMGRVQKHMSAADAALKDEDTETAREEMQKAFAELRRAHEDAKQIHDQ